MNTVREFTERSRVSVSTIPCDRCGGSKRDVPKGSPLCNDCLNEDLEAAFKEERPYVEPTRPGRGSGLRYDSKQFPTLPPRAMVQAIERRMATIRARRSRPGFIFLSSSGGEMPDEVVEDVCISLGITSKAFRDWKHLPGRRITFDVADMVMVRAGWLWWEVWGEVEPPARRGRPMDVLRWIDEVETDYTFVKGVFEYEDTGWRVTEEAA